MRDALLGRLAPRPDLDLVVPGNAVELARSLASRWGGAVVVLDQERSMARLVLNGWTIDLARCMGKDLRHDLLRRDYSANAIALPLQPAESAGELLDPSGGLADLGAGRLRAISEANLLEDPLRLLRGCGWPASWGSRLRPPAWAGSGGTMPGCRRWRANGCWPNWNGWRRPRWRRRPGPGGGERPVEAAALR